MSLEVDEIGDRRKTPHSETLENTVAIARLTEMTSNLTKDTDRLVKHIEKILPIHAVIANLKTLLYTGLFVSSSFGVWITIEHFNLKDKVNTYIAVQNQKDIDRSDKVTYNKNQIQYLKGRIK